MAEKPTVSIVIPSLNRETLLTNAVTELLASSSRHMEELIVVDQSDVGNASLANLEDPRFLYLRANFKSLPKARNFGTKLARGDVILFLDDDVVDLANIVDAHAQAHFRTGAHLVTGPVLWPGENLVPVTSLSKREIADLPFGKRQIANLNAEYVPMFAPGCNASYRKALLDEIDGFDENFLGSAVGEDAEMSHRVVAAGRRIIYDPRAALVHLSAQAGGCRDEMDWARRAEITILNAHYFYYKVGAKSLLASNLFRIICVLALSREGLGSNSIGTIVRRAAKLLQACWKARFRTAELLRVSNAQPGNLNASEKPKSI
jgi:GT2 family glycosyltransferase